jgi:outer membrane lipoprotein-sorting protein
VDADLAQASVRSVEAANLSGIAALLLNTNVLTREQLLARYQFSVAGERDGVTWISVVPRQAEPGINRLMIGLDSDSMVGQVTRIELTKIFKNIAIDAALFQYTPPRGMSVLRQ